MTELYEPVIGMDDFRRPKVLKDWEALAVLVIMILFGKPGFYPSHPEIGIQIQKYKNKKFDEIEPDEIKIQLAYQCSLVRDGIEEGQIDILKTSVDGNPALVIIIPITSEEYKNELLIGIKSEDDNYSYNYQLIDANES